ncbi:MAG: FecR domain-containing protein, partial [Campylobacterota bacterium]|nr:FecR domain-containing protein [Campylobacterota bacterium]
MKAILLLFILMNYMFASIGTVVSINGEAIIDRNNVMHKVKKNDVIEKNDVIKTFNQTLLKIVLHDKTQISLGENSSLNIKNYLYNEQSKQDNSVELNFFKGTFKTVTGRIGKLNPRKFKLKTKNASIGIRGTIIEGDQNRVACTQGLISVTSAGVTQMVKAGEVTKTMHNKPPSKPTVYKGGVFKKPEKSVALKEKELIEAKVEEPEPTQAEPEPTEPEPMEPEPTEPEPTEPEPTEPEPIQPEPTEPEPIQPEPTEPEPIAIPFLPFMPDPIVETQNTLGNNDYTTWGTWTISQGNE